MVLEIGFLPAVQFDNVRPRLPTPLTDGLRRNRWYLGGSRRHLGPTATTSPIDGAAILREAVRRLQAGPFQEVDARTKAQLAHVLAAFRTCRVGTEHFGGVNGYGHGDLGRDVVDSVFAKVFHCEAALVRLQFFSGTHAIAAALFGVLRPGDELLSIAGPPYDTLEEVIGTRPCHGGGSLADFGVRYRELPLKHDGAVDLDGIPLALTAATRVVFIQKSCGYSWRPSLSLQDIRRVVDRVKSVRPDIVCLVDNCYGEFVEDVEPTHPSIGADIAAGSLIKNCGGTIALTGGYVAGRADLVQAASNRLSAPGVAGGATLGQNHNFLHGLFLGPQMVGEAVKGAMLVAEVMAHLGYPVNPAPGEIRRDIIQAVQLGSREAVLKFCQCVQANCPVGSYILPTAGATSGYADEVVFADGTFVDGSTLELSADGPLREPYAVFAQGGTHWTHWQLVLEHFLEHYNE
eukprot:CAMPEP_0184689876 /NCGR_PEP_ID=MMETSP0312-20130426/30903_1 /TAXON_ID=31354 /ORGANISM="Compsopogon coeruleus, Strain SAG 36.94" /LENGTH=460 /DNA_ID=CAMNT_0027147281 /DNA_START=991 /DNA_END=2373 /DNA_ORIENTATION=+